MTTFFAWSYFRRSGDGCLFTIYIQSMIRMMWVESKNWNPKTGGYLVVSNVFSFHPDSWSNDPIWRRYVPDGWFNHHLEGCFCMFFGKRSHLSSMMFVHPDTLLEKFSVEWRNPSTWPVQKTNLLFSVTGDSATLGCRDDDSPLESVWNKTIMEWDRCVSFAFLLCFTWLEFCVLSHAFNSTWF